MRPLQDMTTGEGPEQRGPMRTLDRLADRHLSLRPPTMRYIAIDWSGARSGSASKIWLAEAHAGQLTRLEGGRSRVEVVDELIAMAAEDPEFIVGLDFAFSAPEWFLLDRGWNSVETFWAAAHEEGEDWLAACEPPLWGRPGKKKPVLSEHFRATENEAAGVGGSTPKSFFQIGGAGAVGTGSIRGLPFLGVLDTAGFSIWPFHPPASPLVVEIYPRLLTGPVVKSNHGARMRYLGEMLPEMSQSMVQIAASSEDAFDAAVSALVMCRHGSELARLRQTADPKVLREGAIWWPAGGVVPQAVEARPVSTVTEVGPGAPSAIVEPSEAGCVFCECPEGEVVAESRHAVAIRVVVPLSQRLDASYKTSGHQALPSQRCTVRLSTETSRVVR